MKKPAALVVNRIKGIVEKILGIFLALFCPLCAWDTMYGEDPSGISVALFFLAVAVLGVFLYIKGFKRLRMCNTFKKYSAIMADAPVVPIEDLANATNCPAERVKQDLQYLISKSFFADAYINEQTSQFVLSSDLASRQQDGYNPLDGQPLVSCVCPHCGAINQVRPGVSATCEYCGSLIK